MVLPYMYQEPGNFSHTDPIYITIRYGRIGSRWSNGLTRPTWFNCSSSRDLSGMGKFRHDHKPTFLYYSLGAVSSKLNIVHVSNPFESNPLYTITAIVNPTRILNSSSSLNMSFVIRTFVYTFKSSFTVTIHHR